MFQKLDYTSLNMDVRTAALHTTAAIPAGDVQPAICFFETIMTHIQHIVVSLRRDGGSIRG